MGRMLFCNILFGPSFFIIQNFYFSSSLQEYKVIVFLCLKVLPATKGRNLKHFVKTAAKFILEELIRWRNMERMLIEKVSELQNYLKRLMKNICRKYVP